MQIYEKGCKNTENPYMENPRINTNYRLHQEPRWTGVPAMQKKRRDQTPDLLLHITYIQNEPFT